MRKLQLFSTAEIDHLLWSAKPEHKFLDDSALEIFTDFDVARPIVIDASTTAMATIKIMEKTHAYMRIVIDKTDKFLGVVSQQELDQHNLMVKAKALGNTIDELLVTDIMISRDSIQAFDFEEIKTAKVKDVVRVLQETGRRHMLVIDQNLHHIRGIIAASDLARKLNIPIEINQRPSFSEIFKASH
ncbi:CBS domain-containing protein [Shewanella intestini]|uniref:CBS domain-containing protein n=1 Tax=Shewanella intestini TaxID=2017544 RepID=A0ABS5I000_9GAMM|nr:MULTISPECIES: CBS domain-containing protein [Shewanella]MBR9727358.1 CBS domain-containing protein [Shewanella intestini]MRG35592.1 CBS domain-containing protein [Shewanella sp. XMDDZSB0408]